MVTLSNCIYKFFKVCTDPHFCKNGVSITNNSPNCHETEYPHSKGPNWFFKPITTCASARIELDAWLGIWMHFQIFALISQLNVFYIYFSSIINDSANNPKTHSPHSMGPSGPFNSITTNASGGIALDAQLSIWMHFGLLWIFLFNNNLFSIFKMLGR